MWHDQSHGRIHVRCTSKAGHLRLWLACRWVIDTGLPGSRQEVMPTAPCTLVPGICSSSDCWMWCFVCALVCIAKESHPNGLKSFKKKKNWLDVWNKRTKKNILFFQGFVSLGIKYQKHTLKCRTVFSASFVVVVAVIKLQCDTQRQRFLHWNQLYSVKRPNLSRSAKRSLNSLKP